MINSSKVRNLCVIPARSGSERIPRKNLKKINGISLVRMAYEAAVASSIFDKIVVSTDDKEFSDGAPWIERPPELSGSNSDISDAIRHALISSEEMEGVTYDYVTTLQPAVPVRTGKIVAQIVQEVIKKNCRGGLTGVEIVPWLWSARGKNAENNWTPEPYPRSQEYSGVVQWQEINSVQVADRQSVIEGKRWGLPLLVKLLPPFAAVDIDNSHDLTLAESVLPIILKCIDDIEENDFIVVENINGLSQL